MKRILYIFQITVFLLICNKANALNYYWVGGTGNWSSFATHWATTSGGSTFHTQVPVLTDNVFFDANSFTAPGQTITIDQTIVNCDDMNWTGVTNAPTFAGASINALNIFGSLTFVPGMTLSFAGPVSFVSTVLGETITSAGKSFSSTVTFAGIGGGWTLQDAFTTTNNILLNNGALTSNNQTVNASRFVSTSGAARALNMGSSTFNISWFAGPDFWSFTPAGMTLNAGTSTINATANTAGWSPVFNGGGLTYYNLFFTGAASASGEINNNNTFNNVSFIADGIINGNNIFNNVTMSKNGTITGNNTYSNLTFSPGFTYTLTSTRTQTITSSLTSTGNCGALIAIKSATQGSQSTISKAAGAVTVSYVTLKDINATGGATFTANNAINLGNNTGWTINVLPSQNLYWVGNTGNWDDGNHWSASSGGAPSGCSPTPVDNVFFDANSFSLAGQTTTINVPSAYCNDMTWTGVTNTPTFAGANTLNIYGSLTFVAGMTLSFSGPVRFEATALGKTITSAGKSFSSTATFAGIGGGWTLQDAFTTTNNILLNNGTLTSNNQTVNASRFVSTSGAVRALNMGSSTFNISWFAGPDFWSFTPAGMTLNAGTSTINATANTAGWSPVFNGGGLTYYNLFFTGAASASGEINNNNTFNNVSFIADGTINGNNIFNDVTMLKNGTITGNNTYANLIFSPGFTYTLTSASTQTITSSLTSTGNCGALIAIKSATQGSQSTISKAAGAVTVSYVTLKDINATGGATFTANNAINLGNNTGWTINAPTPLNLYWVGNGGDWGDGSHWSTSSGGAPSGCSPSPVDHVFFDANSFSLAGQTTTINVPSAYCNDMTWTGVTNTPTFAGANTLNIFGSLTLNAGMTLSFSGPVRFEATALGKTITSAGKSFSSTVTFAGIGGGWTLQDAFTTTNNILLNNGTLTSNNQTVNASRFVSTSGAARALNMGSSTFNISWFAGPDFWSFTPAGMTLNAGTSTINATANTAGWSPVFNGGGLTYYNLFFTGAASASGEINNNNTFNDVSFIADGTINGNNIFNDVTMLKNGTITGNNTYANLTFSPGFTYILTSGRTQTLIGLLNAIGTGGFPIAIHSSSIGSATTFFKSSGIICVAYCQIRDNTATGGASFYATPTSTDISGNTGWDFITPCTICANTSSSISPSACASYNSPSGNYTWTSTGSYLDTIPNAQGCDSIITINLSINNSYANATATTCNSYTAPSGTVYTISGIYQDIIPNAMSCDSIITINLTVNTVNSSITQVDDITLQANALGAAYQWLDCNNIFSPVDGATSQVFNPTSNGNYAVRVTENGCVDTSLCIPIVTLGIMSNTINGLIVSPNPTQRFVHVNLGDNYSEISVNLLDAFGKLIGTYSVNGKTEIDVDLGQIAVGMYTLKIKADTKLATVRIMKIE